MKKRKNLNGGKLDFKDWIFQIEKRKNLNGGKLDFEKLKRGRIWLVENWILKIEFFKLKRGKTWMVGGKLEFEKLKIENGKNLLEFSCF